MDQVIQKAIEGGYDKPLHEDSWAPLILDPDFFQALGKSCGWEISDLYNKDGLYKKAWCIFGTRFQEINLTEGWESAVSYLTSLINE